MIRRLTDAEIGVLQLIARGSTDRRAAEQIGISPATARTHMSNAMRKLHAHTRTHAVAIALREKLIEC